MENKYFKYGLIGVVVLVWGAIIYRVVGGMSGPDVPVVAVRSRPKIETPAIREEFVLFADYPDPFIPEPDSMEMIADGKKSGLPVGNGGPAGYPGNAGSMAAAGGVSSAPKPAAPTLQSFLLYIGMISNPEKKLKIAIISLHGKEMLVKEKEKREDVLVRKIDKDKIGVVYKGRYVEIEKSN